MPSLNPTTSESLATCLVIDTTPCQDVRLVRCREDDTLYDVRLLSPNHDMLYSRRCDSKQQLLNTHPVNIDVGIYYTSLAPGAEVGATRKVQPGARRAARAHSIRRSARQRRAPRPDAPERAQLPTAYGCGPS